MEKLLLKLLKNKGKVNVNEIMSFCEDILLYLNSKDEDEYETNQIHLGMKNIFRGYIVSNQYDTNFSKAKYSECNRVIIKHSINYYMKCQHLSNKITHNEQKQHKRILTWYHNEYNKAIENQFAQVKQFAINKKLNIDSTNTETIR